jgi:hypothetical protein
MVIDVINRIRTELISTFDDMFDWFSVDDTMLYYSPASGGWNVKQILEHISLTNHYLLILIRKGVTKAMEKSQKENYLELADSYDLNWEKLKTIGQYKSFIWNRPEHMEPTGKEAMENIKSKLDAQLQECLGYLGKMRNGEGILFKTMMTVNNLGKIDMYHYIYFLAQHAKRHLAQMEKIKAEAEKLSTQ